MHKDVFIFTGLDVGLGAGSAKSNRYTTKKSNINNQSFGTWTERGITPNRFAVYAFTRPQIGARISWGAFIAGYSLGVPLEVNSDFEDLLINLNFKHEFSIGLKFNHRKELNRKFFKFSY